MNIIKYYLFSSNQNIKFKDLVFDLKGNCNDVNNIVEIILSNYIGFKYQFSKEINEFVNKKNNVKIFVNKIKNLEWPNNQENHKINDFIKIRYMNQFFFKPRIKEIFSNGTYKLFLPYSEYPYFYKNSLFKFYEKNITGEIKDSLIELNNLKKKKNWLIKKNVYNISWKLFPYEDKTFPIIKDIEDLNITISDKNKDIAIINGKIEK